MRSQLEPLLGQRVRGKGIINRWDNEGHLLLINVALLPYESDDIDNPIRVSHLWQAGVTSEVLAAYRDVYNVKIERLINVDFVTDIIRYERQDGSADFGLDCHDFTKWDHVSDTEIALMAKRRINSKLVAELERLKNAIDSQTLLIPPEVKFTEARKGIYDSWEIVHRSYQAMQERLQRQVHYQVGRDRPLPGKKLKPVKGFAIGAK